MTRLDAILEDPAVEVRTEHVQLDREAVEARAEAVEAKENRAVAGVVRDADDAVLLLRRTDPDSYDGWQLPGSPVGHVIEFDERLRDELADLLDAEVEHADPFRVHRQTAVADDLEASLYYVLYRVEIDREGERPDVTSPRDGIELSWFGDPPEDVVNPSVIDALLRE